MRVEVENQLEFAGSTFLVSRPHPFGLVIERSETETFEDYLHDHLLSPANRESFFQLIESEGLVVCKNVRTTESSYRKVRGKSSAGRLSQAEYYHHDGCSCPTKPRIVEIRLPFQKVERQIATAIAPFRAVIGAMLLALPDRPRGDSEFARLTEVFSMSYCDENRDQFPPCDQWDQIQGRITRLVRRELDAESCRAYFREVDQIADAYVLPWEMGESRLMLNSTSDLSQTMQHRRAFQQPRKSNEQNGSLVKRWTAEELAR